MTHDPGDQDLRGLFADLKARDRRSAPGFDALMARALARPARKIRRVPLFAAAVAVLAFAGAAGALLLRHRAPAFALASWQSPTAFLLHGPGDDILRTIPSVSASVVRLKIGPTEHNR